MDTFEALTPGSMAIILVGVTILGGAIGSFLNVVIYRLPAGLSLVHPPSRCPRCEHPIRAYDNVPVFGWILLRGKCRDCGEPISARYPMIEAVVALTFLLVAWLEWFGPKYGFGLPGTANTLESLVARAGLHVLLLTTLLGVGMIEWDRERVPDSIWLPVIFAGIGTWAFFPDFSIIHAWEYPPTIMAGLIDGLAGAAAGLVVGSVLMLIERLCGMKKEQASQRGPLLLGSMSVGLVFGWQVIVAIGMIYLPIQRLGIQLQKRKVQKKPFPFGLFLFGTTLVGMVVFSMFFSRILS